MNKENRAHLVNDLYGFFEDAHRMAAKRLEEAYPLGTEVEMCRDWCPRKGTIAGYQTQGTYGNSLQARLIVRNNKTKKTKAYHLYQITIEGEDLA
jgi:hypothetical protein